MAKSVTYKQKCKAALAFLSGEGAEDIAADVGCEPAEVEAWARSYDEGGVERVRRDFPPASKQPAFPKPPSDLATVGEALAYSAPKLGDNTYGGYLSNALAVVLANALRSRGFEGVLPDERGGFESRVRGARGLKKLDVNFSTPEMGLGLGLSIKTISKPDPGTKRYTKNYSRNDNELRAEAVDYHRRQPWSVLVGFLFLPIDACDDATANSDDEEEAGVSSFGAAVKYFRHRTPRAEPDDEPDRFEAFFVCIYEPDGSCGFWPVHEQELRPPRNRRPTHVEMWDLDGAIDNADEIYRTRNEPTFEWAPV